MMNKFAIVLLTAAITLGSGSVIAASGNGSSNAAADAGAIAPGAKDNLAPNHVDNSKINTEGSSALNHKKKHHGMSANDVHKNTQCKEGNCSNINSKVGSGADTKTNGTSQ
ncbi:YbgS-like family protein [Erwinia amylovora]|uniref:YbgS-like family protein n=1 Tax=Erwinia amylovora TaxID=552 RepID=UPI0020C1267C|nr:YbgS-like family protein [Erwinia amylovora]MCK8186103.1 YbgS-like family protein [Erwinia amylovora]MCK8243233.1 YbgS-like family protein [Erwinia amylovora]MCK8246674.1 YbgS-like family protein [Erwinia amylovora]MCK8250040.1 YbgS-like family protein [Erwinia amylovora]MCK8266082.1 YbgS-like family protein [Erwinia amylovora]